MTKKILIPNSKDMIDECISYCDGIILGIKDLSVNLPFYIELDELKELEYIRQDGKEIFVMLNKNMHNKDLKKLEYVMKELEQYSINGVFYYDISVVNLKQKLNISYHLIWSQEHLTTNAGTCNFWSSFDVHGAYLSNEITLDEIKEIRNNTKLKLFVNIFGYLPMFDSKRHLVNNYLSCFNLNGEGNLYFIEKEGKKYPIIDDELGTTVYSSAVLNAIPEYLDLSENSIDYVVLNSFLFETSIMKKILYLLDELCENNRDATFEKINNLCNSNIDKGFLYKETVYKVKGDSK